LVLGVSVGPHDVCWFTHQMRESTKLTGVSVDFHKYLPTFSYAIRINRDS
jgi:hypothetical protein